MRVNMEKVAGRYQNLSELDRRADALQEGGSQFQHQSVKHKRNYWWENIKMWLIIGVVLIVIIVIVVVSTIGTGTGSPTATVTAKPGLKGSSPENESNGVEDTVPPENGGTNGGAKRQPSSDQNK